MGGNVNIWKYTRTDTGIEDRTGTKINSNVFSSSNSAFNDGKLEFATFPSLLHVITGSSKRILQDDGPFVFRFAEGEETVTYVNIDGEFYKLINPISITIRRAEGICKDGSLRVLVNDKKKSFA